MRKRGFEDFSNIELADYIESRSSDYDGVPESFREGMLRFLWQSQAFVPSKRLPPRAWCKVCGGGPIDGHAEDCSETYSRSPQGSTGERQDG